MREVLQQILEGEPVSRWSGKDYYAIPKEQLERIVSILEVLSEGTTWAE